MFELELWTLIVYECFVVSHINMLGHSRIANIPYYSLQPC